MEDQARQDEIHIVLYRRRLALGVAAALVLGLGYAVLPSTMTLTTVYPAPSGVYRNLITTQSAFFARDSGNVGIGTTMPAEKLHVIGNTRVNGLLRVRSGAGDGNLDISDNGGGTATINNSGNSYLNIGSAVSTNFISGNVGIGTGGVPGAKLEVAGNIIASDPTISNHVATKAYVDAQVGGGITTFRVVSTTADGHYFPCPSVTGATLRGAQAAGRYTAPYYSYDGMLVAPDCSSIYAISLGIYCMCFYGSN